MLHQTPPGLQRNGDASVPAVDGAPQPVVLCSREDLFPVNAYDANMNGWQKLLQVLDTIEDTPDREIDWSDGAAFPWWLWLANNGAAFRELTLKCWDKSAYRRCY